MSVKPRECVCIVMAMSSCCYLWQGNLDNAWPSLDALVHHSHSCLVNQCRVVSSGVQAAWVGIARRNRQAPVSAKGGTGVMGSMCNVLRVLRGHCSGMQLQVKLQASALSAHSISCGEVADNMRSAG